MRLPAVARMGFFPIPPPVLPLIAAHLAAPAAGGVYLLDPCCGDGHALGYLGDALRSSPEQMYGVELDAARAATARERLGTDTILGPASALTSTLGYNYGLAFVNPPFSETEMGGEGRNETAFVVKATSALMPGGVLVFVLPERVFRAEEEFREHIDTWYQEFYVYSFPKKYRKYDEIVLFARKRVTPIDASAPGLSKVRRGYLPIRKGQVSEIPALGSDTGALVVRRWSLSTGKAPTTFRKRAYTKVELCAALHQSPLNKLLEAPPEIATKRPPLPLHKGHIGLLLASGRLNGLVCPPGEPPHVLRGGTAKEKPLVDQTEVQHRDGSSTTKQTYREKIVPCVRIVREDGEIITFLE